MQDIRWKQRFQNFEKAFLKLKESVEAENLNELEKNGLVQRFEFTVELAWKTLKDFLEKEGLQVKSPKETIRQAFNSGYIDNAQGLMDALDLRNKLSHDYDGIEFEKSEGEIRNVIFPLLDKLYKFLSSEAKK